MTARTRLAFGAIAGVVVLGAAVWLGSGASTRGAPAPAPGGRVQVVAGSLDDLLMDLQLVPMGGQTPAPFSLERLDGKRVALADVAGRPALLYFWATW